MPGKPFVEVVLRGDRFDEHSIPVDVLVELAAYGDFVADVARHLYFADHRGRRRVPRGFEDSFQLALIEIRKGSSIAALARKPSATLLPDEFDRARDLIARTISSNGAPLPVEFPRESATYFDRLGRRLRKHDALEFRTPGGGPAAIYDLAVRKRLILAQAPSYSGAIEILAHVIGADVEKRTFRVKLPNERFLGGTLQRTQEDVVLRALVRYHDCLVRLRGLAEFSAEDEPTELVEVEDVALLDEETQKAVGVLEGRISHAASTAPGWSAPNSPAPDPMVVRRGRDLLLTAVGLLDFPPPHVYPTPEGGVQAEWTAGRYDLTIVLDPATHEARVELDVLDSARSDEWSFTEKQADEFAARMREIRATVFPGAGE